MNDEAPARLDVALAIRRTIAVFAADFAAVVLAGLALVTLPGIITRGIVVGPNADTLLITLRGVCALLFVALVSWGVVARLRGRALPPRLFVREGLARATPGLKVALLAGAGIVIGLIIQLFARPGTVEGWLLDVSLLALGLWAAAAMMPLVPVAVVERLGPIAAIRRALALTEGNRNRTLALALLLALALAPSAALLAGFAGPAGSLAPGGILLTALFELVAWSLIATVPAVVYAGLKGAK